MTDPQESVIASVVDRILREEGGVADVGDGAGVTRYGQTAGWLSRWRLPVPQSAQEAAMNYRSWLEQTNLDALCTEDDALTTIVIDFAVNSGERPAIASLQRALGVVADGSIGPVTLTALAVCRRAHVGCAVLADRIELGNGLIHDQPGKFAPFARGWAKRWGRQLRSLA